MKSIINTIEWPASVEAFEFPALTLPQNNQYFNQVQKSKVVGEFSNKSNPNLLHTRLDEPLVQLHRLSIEGKIVLEKGKGIEPGAFEKITKDDAECFILGGIPGVGKTRWIREFSYCEFTLLLDAIDPSEESGGGSADLVHCVTKSSAKDSDLAESQLKQWIPCILLGRQDVLVAAIGKYGRDKFLPRHWMALQLFSKQIVKDDVFQTLAAFYCSMQLETLKDYVNRKKVARNIFKAIVLEEAQELMDLRRFFSSSKFPNTCNGVFTPIQRAIANFVSEKQINTKFIATSTGLLLTKMFALLTSEIEDETKVKVLGVATFLDVEDVMGSLQRWGVTDIDRFTASSFVGRPRFAAHLASSAMKYGNSPEIMASSVKHDLKNTFSVMFAQQFPGMGKGIKKKNVELDENVTTMISMLWNELLRVAFNYMLGGKSNIDEQYVEAMAFCFGGLKMTKENEIESNLAEPLLFQVLVLWCRSPIEKGISKEMVQNQVGIEYEKFLVCYAEILFAYVVEKLERMKIPGQWQFYQKQSESGRLALKLQKNSNESEILRKIMKEQKGTYPSVLFPFKTFGVDIIILGKRIDLEMEKERRKYAAEGRKQLKLENEEDKKWLLIKIHSTIRYESCLKKARSLLEFPYGVNKDVVMENKSMEDDENEMEEKKQTTTKRAKEFSDLEKECQVVHLICQAIGGKKPVEGNPTRKDVVELIINRYSVTEGGMFG